MGGRQEVSVSPERVIVVGAGPVGLALALKLAQNGVAVTLLESLTATNFLDQVPRAGSNHPVTLEMYADIGLYDRLLARGLVAPKFQYWDREHDEMFAEFDHAAIADDTRFPFVLQCERIKIIEEALAFAHEHDLIDIRMGTTFVDFTQGADWVDAIVDNAAGERETIRGRYVVSAEGARSVVRKALDIEFEGFTYPEQTLNIVTAYDFKQHGFADRNYISDPGEYVNLFHWPGPPEVWRVHFPSDPNTPESELLSDEHCQELLRKFLPAGSPYEIVYRNLYTVHQRVAAAYRRGRAILAGDSAHVNTPIGGMGMNAGVHDAINLAGKLITLMRGEGDDDLLDRYERQRRNVAIEHVKAQTMRNKKVLTEKDPVVRKQNHDDLRRTAADPKKAREFILRTSMINMVREANAIA
jgi:3-(3-hydroxy-phenyl)propionate hydroxylase